MRSRAGEARGRARSFDLNSRNSVALAAGSRAGNEHTTARGSTPDCSSASTLSNSTLRSSVTISSVSLSFTWRGELADGVERVVVDDRAAGLEHGEEVDDEGRRVGQEQPDLGPLA